MKKLQTFIYSFKNSLTNPKYYQDVVKAPFQFSLKYLAVLVYFSILVTTMIYAVEAAFMLPKLPGVLKTIDSRLDGLYPKELVIVIENGVLSTNQEEPYFINLPELEDTEEYEHLITFDTQGNVEDYAEYKTAFLVTDRDIVYPDSDREGFAGYRVARIEDNENVTITDADYNTLMTKINPVFDLLPKLAPWLLIAGVILIPVIGTLFSTLWNFIAIAFLSLITWAISGIFKNKLSYTKVLQMGLHAVTLSIVLTLFLNILAVELPLIFIASFLFWMVVILARYKETIA